MRRISLVLGAVLLVACDQEETAPPAGGQTSQLQLGREMQPGEEAVFCRRFVLERDLEVSAIEHHALPGQHHVLVYRDPVAAEDVTNEVFACGDIPGALVYTSQSLEERFSFPAGVGVKLGAGEVLRMEIHFVNTTTDVRTAETRLDFWEGEAPIETEASSLFFYHRDIAIPPMASWSTTMRCPVPEDIDLLVGLPHVHRRGTGFRVYRVDAGGERHGVLESDGYGDLESVRFAEPTHVAAGETLEVECDFQNDTADWIYQGPSGPADEMCLLLGSYYPRMDRAAELCTVETGGPLHQGEKTCGEALACLQAADPYDVYANPRCFSESCPGSSAATNALGNCAFMNCPECALQSPDCNTCVLSKCSAEIGVCAEAQCE